MGIYYRWKAEPIGLDALGRLVLDLSARVQKKKISQGRLRDSGLKQTED